MSSAMISNRADHINSHTVASFLLKTFEILEKSQFSDIISWAYDDDTFAIKNILQFTNQVLPKYFRHRNFSSFVRQLNMYDFHKVKQSNDYIVFRNPLFRKGQSHLLKKIRRKAPKKNQSQKKINSSIGITHFEESTQLKVAFQNNIQDSMLVFQKSLLSLETIYSLINKKQNIVTPLFTTPPSQLLLPDLLNKVSQIRNIVNISFKAMTNINNSINQSLTEKQTKYRQFQNNSYSFSSKKNVETGSNSKSYQMKSECSIGDKKEAF